MKQIKKQTYNGITLVALVITIIILLILAGITISTLTQSGLFGKAKEAKEQYSKAAAMEKLQMEVLASYDASGDLDLAKLKENITGNIDGAAIEEGNEFPLTVTVDGEKFIVKENGEVSHNGKGTTAPAIDDPIEKIKNTILSTTDNTTVTDLYGNLITIPAGFKIKVDEDTNNATTVDKGIVIIDSEENEFVWIPVGKIYTDKERTEANAKTIELNRYTFDEDGNPTAQNDAAIVVGRYKYQELEVSIDENTVAKSIVNFKKSVEENKGYYIGRYEARKNSSETMTEKVSDNVYNKVNQTGAAAAAREMYDNTKPFTSDLINSYAWDTATLFLQRCGTNPKYSREKIKISTFSPTGTTTLSTQDIQCNVYDMASNIYEWTTETCDNDVFNPAVNRGGSYLSNTDYTSGRKYYSASNLYDYNGFRPILYVNV